MLHAALVALRRLRSVPAEAWWGVAIFACILAALWGVKDYGRTEYARGKADARRGAAFDSAVVAMATAKRVEAKAKTDTVVRRIAVTRYRVDTLIQRLPADVRVVPSVDTLVRTVNVLTAQMDSVYLQGVTERQAADMERSVLAAQVTAHRVTINAQADTIAVLEKRPTKLNRAVWTFTGVVAGAVTGFVMGVIR
jgi:hypothetical protein